MKHRRLFRLPLAAVCLLSICLSACGDDSISSGSSVISSLTQTTSSVSLSTTSPTTAPTLYVDPETGIRYENQDLQGKRADYFELPLEGATGYASVNTPVYTSADQNSDVLATLQPGDAFTILEEVEGVWWRMETDSVSGWVDNTCCYLNIPDVVPSIVFDNTNAYSSVFLSSGKDIPDITGQLLYDSLCRNERYGDERYVVAANYWMVKKIYAAQQMALAEGYTLVINETFRPYDVQLQVAAQLKQLYTDDPAVKAGIDQRPWGIGWFIANKLSTHQLGCAMDVSLAKVRSIRYALAGDYQYTEVTAYEECAMPTPIHELSAAAVSMKKPVNSASATAWIDVEPADTMTEDALRLKRYCTQAGLSPLASEWWHFNDLEAKKAIGSNYTTDVFYIHTCRSRIPEYS